MSIHIQIGVRYVKLHRQSTAGYRRMRKGKKQGNRKEGGRRESNCEEGGIYLWIKLLEFCKRKKVICRRVNTHFFLLIFRWDSVDLGEKLRAFPFRKRKWWQWCGRRWQINLEEQVWRAMWRGKSELKTVWEKSRINLVIEILRLNKGKVVPWVSPMAFAGVRIRCRNSKGRTFWTMPTESLQQQVKRCTTKSCIAPLVEKIKMRPAVESCTFHKRSLDLSVTCHNETRMMVTMAPEEGGGRGGGAGEGVVPWSWQPLF